MPYSDFPADMSYAGCAMHVASFSDGQPGGTADYLFDDVGNVISIRTARADGSRAIDVTYEYGNGALESIHAILAISGVEHVTHVYYDEFRRVREITTEGTYRTHTTYEYDERGLRRYVFDGDFDGVPEAIEEYIYSDVTGWLKHVVSFGKDSDVARAETWELRRGPPGGGASLLDARITYDCDTGSTWRTNVRYNELGLPIYEDEVFGSEQPPVQAREWQWDDSGHWILDREYVGGSLEAVTEREFDPGSGRLLEQQTSGALGHQAAVYSYDCPGSHGSR